MKQKKLAIFLLFIILISASGCNIQSDNKANTITVEDCVGRSVEMPAETTAICALDPFAGTAVIMYGYGDKMVATVGGVQRNVLLQTLCPELETAEIVKEEGSMNAESILELGVDLILIKSDMYSSSAEKEKLDALDIPYLVIAYDSMEEQCAAFQVIGNALGQQENAEKMNDYYDEVIDRVSKIVENIPEDARPSLYHACSAALQTDAAGSLAADWIAVTGAENVALDGELTIQQQKYYTTLEQIYAWDPDYIICSESGVSDYVLSSVKWSGLRAVESGTVYQVPIGVSRWGHSSSVEIPLAIQWLAKTLYPDYFSDLNIEDEARYFYDTFFDYDLPEEMMEQILSGTGIRTAGINVLP